MYPVPLITCLWNFISGLESNHRFITYFPQNGQNKLLKTDRIKQKAMYIRVLCTDLIAIKPPSGFKGRPRAGHFF